MIHKIEDYDFDLPAKLIAQYPKDQRDASRLLVYNAQKQTVVHAHFFSLKKYLREGDLLILNNSRVFPARLKGHRKTGGSFEILLTRPRQDNSWLCLVKPAQKMKKGMRFFVSQGLSFEILEDFQGGFKRICFDRKLNFEDLERFGQIPLPPYIQRSPEDLDNERYQTVFSSQKGSVAAPTAGLHFTEAMIGDLQKQGIQVATITLHVGPGTFRPVQ